MHLENLSKKSPAGIKSLKRHKHSPDITFNSQMLQFFFAVQVSCSVTRCTATPQPFRFSKIKWKIKTCHLYFCFRFTSCSLHEIKRDTSSFKQFMVKIRQYVNISNSNNTNTHMQNHFNNTIGNNKLRNGSGVLADSV